MKKWFFSYYLKNDVLKYFIITMISCIIVSSLTLTIPLITRYVINVILPLKNIKVIYKYLIIMLLIYLLGYIFMRIMVFYGHKFGLNIERNIRLDIHDNVIHKDMDFFDSNKNGKIANTIINDTRRISEFSHHVIENMVMIFIPFVIGFFILISINIYLTIFEFTYLFFTFLIVRKKRVEASKQYEKIYSNISKINESNFEIIKNIELVKSYNNENIEIINFNKRSQDYTDSYFQMAWNYTKFATLFDYLLSYLQVGIILISIYLKINNLIDYGTVVMFLLYTSMISNSFSTLIDLFQEMDKGFKSVAKVYDLYLEKPKTFSSEENNFINGDIIFNNISYEINNNSILSNVSFKIKQGTKIALVGHSGSGKTTLLKSLLNFINISNGEVVINNNNVNTIKTKQLMDNIGYLSQDNFVFSDTILNNIKISNITASYDDIVEASKKAQIHDFIMTLPNKYDTNLNEYGTNLSGGQKQRISLARIFLKNPKIIILDEATSALDKKTESEITKIINSLSEDKTIITIAHNLQTIVKSDQIFLLEHGVIVESGTHDYLLSKNGKYTDMYNI